MMDPVLADAPTAQQHSLRIAPPARVHGRPAYDPMR